MNLSCQSAALTQLKQLATEQRHSICIEGPQGCGKTYLARQFADLLSISDFQKVLPTVNDIRQCISECYQLSSPVVICIENLDAGVAGASHALLKMLEEPKSNVYVVVTCRNLYRIPDTIISRSVCVTTGAPTDSDIAQVAAALDAEKFAALSGTPLWRCISSLTRVNEIMGMTTSQVMYFIESVPACLKFNDTVSNITWKLGHYNDNSEVDVTLVLRYIMEISPDRYIQRQAMLALNELSYNRVAPHAVLAMFTLTCKYTEA